MANKRISALTEELTPATSDVVPIDGATTRKTTIVNLVDAARPFASQAEAEAGSGTTQTMNPLASKQLIDYERTQARSFTGIQTFTTTSAGVAPVRAESSDAGATGGPFIDAARTSATAAASDAIGALRFRGMDSAGNETGYAQVRGRIIDPTDSSEDGAVEIVPLLAGVQTQAFAISNGVYVGAATGGYQGTGTVNATGYYNNGVNIIVDEDDMASDSATRLPSQQSVKAYVSANKVADRTALAALNTTTYAASHVFLNEAGREGLFKRVTTVAYSGWITADTRQAILVISTHNASYAWLRVDIPHLDLRWAGGVADSVYSGTYLTNGGFAGTDNTAALVGLISLQAVVPLPIYIPKLEYGFKLQRVADNTDSAYITVPSTGMRLIGDGEIHIDHDPTVTYSVVDVFRSASYGVSTQRDLYAPVSISGVTFRGLHNEHPAINQIHVLALSNHSRIDLFDVKGYDIIGKFSRSAHNGHVQIMGGDYQRIGSGVLRFANSGSGTVIGPFIKDTVDDIVDFHTTDPGTYELAGAIHISGVRAENTGNIIALGGRDIYVGGCSMRYRGAIYVGGQVSTEGAAASHSIRVIGNTLTDTIGTWNSTTHVFDAISTVAGALAVNGSPGSVDDLTTAGEHPFYEYDSAGTPNIQDMIALDDSSNILFQNYTGTTNTLNPGVNYAVHGNTVTRTKPAVAAYSDFNSGAYWCGEAGAGVYDPAVGETNFCVHAILLRGEMINASVTGNTTFGHRYGASIYLTYPGTSELSRAFRNVVIANNIGTDCKFGVTTVMAASAGTDYPNWGIEFIGNVFDCDPFLKHASRTTPIDGSWQTIATASDQPAGYMLRNIRGWTIRGGSVANCYSPVVTRNDIAADGNIDGLTVICQPAAYNYSASNKGVAQPGEGSTYKHRMVDCTPSSATYGRLLNTCVDTAEALPSGSEIYLRGHFIKRRRPVISGGTKTLIGWARVTDGTAHVSGTDWAPFYGTTS